MQINPFPQPEWLPKRNDAAVGIDVKVLLQDKRLLVAQLRFAAHASFEAHDAPWDCHVMCLEGSGHVRVGDETARLAAGQSVLWPKAVVHQLWTDDSTMITLMIEHLHQADDAVAAWREHQRRARVNVPTPERGRAD